MSDTQTPVRERIRRGGPRKPDFAAELADLVHTARMNRNMTQYEVAEAIGAKPAFVSKVETERIKGPSSHLLYPMADVLGIPRARIYKITTGKEWDDVNESRLDPDILSFAVWIQSLDGDTRHVVMSTAKTIAETYKAVHKPE